MVKNFKLVKGGLISTFIMNNNGLCARYRDPTETLNNEDCKQASITTKQGKIYVHSYFSFDVIK